MEKRILYLIMIGLLWIDIGYAQVGINTEKPCKLTDLQVKNIEFTNPGGENDTIPRGVMIPRLTQEKRDAIVIDDEDDANSLMIYNIDEDCYNYYSKIEKEWQSLCGKLGKADFTIPDCSRIRVYGVYQNDVSLTSANYLIIPVTVDKEGSYTITVIPDPENGYYFYTSGEFLSKGTFDVMLPGAGTPARFTPTGSDGDEIKITLNGVELACSNKPKIKIEDSTVRPRFGLSCNSVTVHGVYKKETAMTSDNKITMRLNVYDGSKGAAYTVQTDVIDGLSFKASGILGDAGAQEITLYAEGLIYNTAPKDFTIRTNSEATTMTCQITVVPVISQKKIVEFAYNSGASYGLASGGDWGSKALLTDNMNFGDNINSIVKYLGFSQITHVAAGAVTTAMLRTNAGLGGDEPADVIFFTYDARPYDNSAVDLLVDYVDKGGVLIYMDQVSAATHQYLLSQIFEEPVSNTNMVDFSTSASYAIKMNDRINDDIINGPFGDCRFLQWGEDFANTRGLTFIPTDAIVYAGGIVADTGLPSSTGAVVSIMKHKTKNFFWFGDSGFIASGGESFAGQTTNPLRVASRTFKSITYPKYPITKPHGFRAVAPHELSLPVCNSIFFANLMAWVVKTAEENGINSGK